MKKRFIAAAAAVSLGLGLGATVVAAGPPAGEVPPHRHYVVTGDGDLVEVGPDACTRGPSRQFDNFHNHVHRGVPGGNGVISASGC